MNELKLIDEKMKCTIPDNEKNRRVIDKMKKMSLEDLYIWKGIYEKMIACEKAMNKKPTSDYHFSAGITLKFYEQEIKLREQTGV